MKENKLAILKQYFGYDSFRNGQEHLIDSMIRGEDVLGVMPTGAGKSICFQLPALMMEGMTIVISPLISLMKDQVNALTQAGIKGAYLNSSLTPKQYYLALERAKMGAYKIIYVAPERLMSEEFLAFAKEANVSMIAVDEAHCISQWGQDFRPSYTKIIEFAQKLPVRPVISAFTATATKQVREDIIASLRLENPNVLVTGFDRSNLFFEVQTPKDKKAALISFLKDKQDKTGIIYCATRKNVEEVCDVLNQSGFRATRYHAGLSDAERKENQEDFIFDRIPMIVATNAFGMGIDKSNASFVVHYNMPKNMESYYQEAGRAGRDGEPAQCLLLYSPQDVRTNLYFIDNVSDGEQMEEAMKAELKQRDRKRLREMTVYCHLKDCLRAYIVGYFGESAPNFCGNCGNCNHHFTSKDITEAAKKILACVVNLKERFGTKVIIDCLRGSKNQKSTTLGLAKLSSYGTLTLPEKQIREIINHLVANDYLCITNSEYPVVKLGVCGTQGLQEDIMIEMKMRDEIEIGPKPFKQEIVRRAVNATLFDKLKGLRFAIAKEQQVPAFLIFTDSTLTDMCLKLPLEQEELLAVSGVGQVKANRYGDRFLKEIKAFAKEHMQQDAKEEVQAGETQEERGEIAIADEPITISMMADSLNCYLLQNGYKKVTGAKINQWLVEEGCLREATEEEGGTRLPTTVGKSLGITTEVKMIRGKEMNINFYGKEMQTKIATHFRELLDFIERKKDEGRK